MGKRKAQEDLSENVNTKRNRKYTARMDDERKATFNNQKALQTAITRSKQKLYQTDEFKEAGDDKRSQLEAATVQETIENRKKKGKFTDLPAPRTSEPKRQLPLYPWDNGDPTWEDLDEDVDETVCRDFDNLNGDTANLAEITQDERDRQMRHYTQNIQQNDYIKAASFHWRKICSVYRQNAKSLKRKLSLLNRRGIDENGNFSPIKLWSHLPPHMQKQLKAKIHTRHRPWLNANNFFTEMEIAILVNWSLWMLDWTKPVDLPGPAQFWDGVKADHILQRIEEASKEERIRARLAWTLVTDDRFCDHIPVPAYRFPLPGITPLPELPSKFQYRFVLDLTEIGTKANDVFPRFENADEDF